MKNLKLLVTAFLLTTLAIGNACGQSTLTLTFTSSGSYGMTASYPTGYVGTFTTNDITFGYYKASNTVSSKVYFLHMDKAEGRFYNTTAINNITEISITFSSKASTSTIYCTTGNSEINTSEITGTKTVAQSASGTYTFTGLSGNYFNLSVSGDNPARIASITIKYGSSAPTTYYDVAWVVEGTALTSGSQTTSVASGSKVTVLPTVPTSSCGGEFLGWAISTDGVVGRTSTEGYIATPSVFTTAADSPAIEDDTEFHAVFRKEQK